MIAGLRSGRTLPRMASLPGLLRVRSNPIHYPDAGCFVGSDAQLCNHEAETGTKSKEARKYIFNCLEDIGQVNVPTELEGGELLAEKVDRREFIDLLKRMLTMDQERRITPGEALQHQFVTLSHLVDYAHCSNVKASVQMMEVCRRSHYQPPNTLGQQGHSSTPAGSLVANFVPGTNGNVTLTFNSQFAAAAAAASIRLLFTMAVMQLRLQQRPANMLQVWLTSLNKHWSGYPVCFADVYFNIFSLFYL